MKAKIEIEMSNAAFEEAPASELARILRELANRVEGDGDELGLIRDINGNTVGKFEVVK